MMMVQCIVGGDSLNILASNLYHEGTGKTCLYNIMPIENIPSVLSSGILCFEALQNDFEHVSVAMNEVQRIRDNVVVPNGLRLHQYANLYFTFNNPMLFKRKDMADELCVLAVSLQVLDIDGCVVSDQNAAKSLVRFFEPAEGIRTIDFQKVHAQYWTHEDYYEQQRHKAIKCAEVLVPWRVDPAYILGAYVVSEEAKDRMQSLGFDKKILVRERVFYR